ncbi:hypothetical protein [Brevundimonas subvibrioides]|uniref:hypothetical protein n=1 Tax=Brevundimonas subvibrioides TaxID=74313 RepID=UPI0022B31E39|nr:hypothetical protein [Brevundimonas subvibrioides]
MTGLARPVALAGNQAMLTHPSPISVQAAAGAPLALTVPETPPIQDDPYAEASVRR